MPVTISRSGRCPWRTSRWRPSSVRLSAWTLSKAATSASTACTNNARAPLRSTSVSGSAKIPGCESWKTLVSVTAYHSFGGEVEASSTPTIRRLIPSCRHQLSPIAPRLARAPARTKSLHVAYSPTLHSEDLPKTHPSGGIRRLQQGGLASPGPPPLLCKRRRVPSKPNGGCAILTDPLRAIPEPAP